MKSNFRSKSSPVVSCVGTLAVLADGQNVNLHKHSQAILTFTFYYLGEPAILSAYYPFRQMKESRENYLREQGWNCPSVPTTGKNALDYQLIRDCKRLIHNRIPDTLVLVANDRDYVPLVKEALEAECRVIIIGRRNCVSHRLQPLVPLEDIYYVEDLPFWIDRAA